MNFDFFKLGGVDRKVFLVELIIDFGKCWEDLIDVVVLVMEDIDEDRILVSLKFFFMFDLCLMI